MEQRIINYCGALTPSRILTYFSTNRFFQTEHTKRPYTFFILGRPGPTGKTWLTNILKRDGFMAFELSDSVSNLVEYKDDQNHVIEDDRNIIIVLNKSLYLE